MLSPFSSWSPSLRVAMSYAYESPDCSIAILDLHKLRSVAAYPLSDLYAGKLADTRWDREFLVFGRVEGEGFSIMPFNPWSTLEPLEPRYKDNPRAPPSGTGANLRLSDNIVHDLRVCISIARPLGPSFVLPFALALFVAITHDPFNAHDGLPRDLRRTYRIKVDEHLVREIFHALDGLNIPFDYSIDPKIIITDHAWTGDMYDVKEWLLVLRAVAQVQWRRVTRQQELGWGGGYARVV